MVTFNSQITGPNIARTRRAAAPSDTFAEQISDLNKEINQPLVRTCFS